MAALCYFCGRDDVILYYLRATCMHVWAFFFLIAIKKVINAQLLLTPFARRKKFVSGLQARYGWLFLHERASIKKSLVYESYGNWVYWARTILQLSFTKTHTHAHTRKATQRKKLEQLILLAVTCPSLLLKSVVCFKVSMFSFYECFFPPQNRLCIKTMPRMHLPLWRRLLVHNFMWMGNRILSCVYYLMYIGFLLLLFFVYS